MTFQANQDSFFGFSVQKKASTIKRIKKITQKDEIYGCCKTNAKQRVQSSSVYNNSKKKSYIKKSNNFSKSKSNKDVIVLATYHQQDQIFKVVSNKPISFTEDSHEKLSRSFSFNRFRRAF